MSDIKFHIPKDETIPTALRLFVDDVYVTYKRIDDGFRFEVYERDENKAKEIVQEIIDRMIYEHDESEHGVSWRTVSLEKVKDWANVHIFDWKYRVRDSY